MAFTRIIQWLGNTLVICAILMVICAVFSLGLFDFRSALTMAGLTLGTGVVGLTFIFLSYNTPAKETNSDALVFLLLFWSVIPFILSFPYVFLVENTGLTRAYFESISAFTTTGASTFQPSELPKSILLWRSLVQWFGGVCVATFAVVILAALNLSGTGVHRSMLFTLKKGELFERLIAIGRVIALVYATVSTVCLVSMVLTGTGFFNALCLSLSAIATGGLTPENGPLASYIGPVSAFFLAIVCVLGAFNIAIIWDLFRLRKLSQLRALIRSFEHRAILVTAGILFLLGLGVVGLGQAYTLIVESLYFVSTTGFDYHVMGIEMLPPAVLISVALIGGSALSTAGGLKMIRLLLLFRHLGTDMGRMSHPSRIIPVTLRQQQIPDRAFLSIWMYFFGYTVIFGIGIMVMATTGLMVEDSVAVAAAMLSNFGPLLPATLPESGLVYSDFTSGQLTAASVFMVLGRVEVLAVFVLFSPGFWQQ